MIISVSVVNSIRLYSVLPVVLLWICIRILIFLLIAVGKTILHVINPCKSKKLIKIHRVVFENKDGKK